MLKVKKIFCPALFTLCICILAAGAAHAAILDNIFEAVVENSFKKAGKNFDDIAGLRKAGDSFSTLLRKDDIFDVTGAARRVADDDVMNLRKINLPAGSRVGDDLMKLPKSQRLLAYSLDDVTSRIARLPNADDIIETTGSKGLMLGACYGDEALLGTYRVAKNDEVWDMADAARAAVRNTDDGAVQMIRANDELEALIDVNRIRRIGDADTMDMAGSVLKKFGKTGMNSMEQFCAWAVKHPKTTLFGLFIAAVKLNPDLVLDSAGNLKVWVLDKFTDVAAKTAADLASTAVELPGTLSRKMLDNLNLPSFLHWPLAFFIAMGMLYFVPVLRVIPKCFFGLIESCFQAIFRRRKPKDQVSKSNDVIRL